MSDDLWILGIHMTKFGKHTDLDVVDLAAEAAMGALADGDVTMKEMGVLAAGNLMNAAAGIGQQLQKQIGQTGIPVYNVANACATGATALRVAAMTVKSGEADMGLAVGVEKLAGAGLLAGGARKEDDKTWTPHGRYGAVAPVDGRIGTETMPGVFAQIGMEYGHTLRRHQLRAVRQDLREEPRPLGVEPAGCVPEEVHPRGDHG
jgi:acetyl-CoA acyltransferase